VLRSHFSFILSAAIILISLQSRDVQASGDNAANFPFQSQAVQFRLNQGFFQAGGDLLEDILKAANIADKNNMIKIVDTKTKRASFLKYNKLKSNIRLQEGQLVSQFYLDIAQSQFFAEKISEDCKVNLVGQLQFEIVMSVTARNSTSVEVPEEKFIKDKLNVEASGCGFIMNGLVKSMLPGYLQSSIQEALVKVANDEELKSVTSADIDQAFKKSNVILNAPSQGPLDLKKKNGQVEVDIGVLGYLSNAKGHDERLSISNPRLAHLNRIGMEWSLDAGFKARSKNIYNSNYTSSFVESGGELPSWGLQPFTKTGQALDFDAGFRLRTSFLKTLFETMYEAGFFNIQLQDSLIDKEDAAISPLVWTEKLKVSMPNGEIVNKDNYVDSRVEIKFAAPPVLRVKDDKEFQLSVSDFFVTLFVKTKSSKQEAEALKIQAKFNLQTLIELGKNAQLGFKFNSRPVSDFKVLSRSGVGQSISNDQIEEQMNASVSALLAKSSVEIPFLKGRKIEIKSLGIEGRSAKAQALSMYLKMK
jgi:hypothetical protein